MRGIIRDSPFQIKGSGLLAPQERAPPHVIRGAECDATTGVGGRWQPAGWSEGRGRSLRSSREERPNRGPKARAGDTIAL